MLHDEVDRRAALAAAEALADIARTIDRERRCPLAMEWTQTFEIGTAAAQLHKIADDLHNIGGVKNLLNCFSVY